MLLSSTAVAFHVMGSTTNYQNIVPVIVISICVIAYIAMRNVSSLRS
jgi:hypothetical protein